MNNCTNTIISKLTETVDYLLGTCMPKLQLEEEETSESLKGPKDDNYRKQELKQLVGMFASRAQSYIDCTRLSLEQNKKFPSFYKLDNMLKTFTIKTNDYVQEMPISNIHSVLNFDQIQNEVYDNLRSNKLITELTLNEKNRFVLIEYIDNKGSEDEMVSIVPILVEEVGNSDPFITVLRILKMYANDKSNK